MLVVVPAAFFVAGCSSDEAPTTNSLVAAPVSSVAATAAAQVTSATTVSPATTTVDTPTSTTIETAPDPALAVRAAVDLAQETYSACLVAMPACDPATLAVARAGDLLARNTQRIEEWNALSYTVRARDGFRYVIESVQLDRTGTTATLTVCIADGSRLVQPNAAPDGSDVIVDDEFISGRSTWDMRLDADGVWRAFDTAPLGETSSEDVCGES